MGNFDVNQIDPLNQLYTNSIESLAFYFQQALVLGSGRSIAICKSSVILNQYVNCLIKIQTEKAFKFDKIIKNASNQLLSNFIIKKFLHVFKLFWLVFEKHFYYFYLKIKNFYFLIKIFFRTEVWNFNFKQREIYLNNMYKKIV